MPSAKLHYDGWVAIPATMRRRLGVDTGDKLDLELTENGLLLRNPNSGPVEVTSQAPVEAKPSNSNVSKTRANPARAAIKRMRGGGKSQEKPNSGLALPDQLRARGRRKSA